ncbi:MAG: hypothetical protein ABSG68_21840 [Thermoguttaceae bacterium]
MAGQPQGVPAGPQHGQHGRQDHQQLHQQEDVPPQPLPDAVDVQILDRLVPQERAGDLDRPPLELQEVQGHDGRRHGRQ